MKTEGTPSILKSAESQAVYRALLDAFDALGSYEVKEKTTSLHITRGRAFAGVHPRAKGVILNLVLDEPLEHARVRKSEQVSKSRHHVEFMLERPVDVDEWLVKRISRAYELAGESASVSRDGAKPR
jgi:hypothetical protein